MSDGLTIDFRWLGRQTGSPVERSFYADIGLAVGGDWLTLLEDQEASTVSTHMRGCAYRLALWFAANWWRLRWEPETRYSRQDVDWRIAHSMASAGGGYVWPNVLFASDGESLAIASRPRPNPASFEPIRYLRRIDARIDASDFERKVDAFMSAVLSRLHSVGIEDEALPELWAEILEERRNPGEAQRRKLEALCGYDPDEAPAAIIEMLIGNKSGLGTSALEEVAAEARHATAEVLRPILTAASSKGIGGAGAFRGRMPELASLPKRISAERPWQGAVRLAQVVRKEWGLGKKPITNRQLADLMGTDPGVFTSRGTSSMPLPMALRSGTNGTFDLYLNSSWTTSRRFATSRLLGDYLCHPDEGRLLPATHARTSRQQFQRAFAQEFLCPFDALQERIQCDQPDEEDIAEAAAYFQVSPLAVKTTLVNRGELDREILNWGE